MIGVYILSLLVVAALGSYQPNELAVKNEDFVATIDTVYNYLSHRNVEDNILQKKKFVYLTAFYYDVITNLLEHKIGGSYERAFDDALSNLQPFGKVPSHVLSAPLRRALDILRVITNRRVEAVQKLCKIDASQKECDDNIKRDDKEVQKHCPEYSTNIKIHNRIIELQADVRGIVDKIVEATSQPSNLLFQFIQNSRETVRNQLEMLADVVGLLVNQKTACRTLPGDKVLAP